MDDFRRNRKPTRKQLEKLAKITDPRQRENLLNAIEAGIPIPDFAWHPLPDIAPEIRDAIGAEFLELLEPIARETGRSPHELASALFESEARFDALVSRARESATSGSNWLCTPIVDVSKELQYADESDVTPLFTFGEYFLTGVTMSHLALACKPGAEESLLVLTMFNSKFHRADVIGLIPQGVAKDKQRLARVFRKLAEREKTMEYPVMPGLPTYITLPPGSPLEEAELKEIVFEFTKSASLVEPVADTIARHRAFLIEPRERVKKHLSDLMDGVKARGGQSRPRYEPMSAGQFEEWWNLVTNPEHVQKELAEVAAALGM